MTYESIRLDVNDGIAVLALNRPKALNAVTPDMLAEMIDAVDRVAADDNARVLVMTGEGRGFCAGADLATKMTDNKVTFPIEAPNGGKPNNGDVTASAMKALHNPLIAKIWHLNKPVISAINGVAAGGGMGLALTCDIAIAARSAKFVCVFAPQLGILPDMGTTYHLQRLVGRARASALAFLGEKLPAEKARDWGMIYDVVDDDKLMDEAMAVARKLADGPPLVWRAVRKAFADSEQNNIDDQLLYEAEGQRVFCATEDFREATIAFVQKRKPEFKGK